MTINQTDRIPLSDGGSNEPTSQEQVRQLVRRVEDLAELLRSQQEQLRKRGMNLPSGSLDGLKSLKNRLETLAKQLVTTSVELKTLRALAEITSLITSTLDTEQILNQVMDTVIQLTGAERGYIVMKNRATGQFDRFEVARGLDKEQLANNSEDGKRGDFIVSKSIVADVAATGQPIITDNASHDSRYQQRQSIVAYALRSIMAVPLKVRDEVIGVVYCDNRILAGLFQEHDRDMLTAFANQAAVAIENARLFQEARMQLEQVKKLRDLMDNIFNSILSGVITTDQQYNVTGFNSAASKILHFDQDMTGMPLQAVLPVMPDDFYPKLKQVQRNDQQLLIEANPIVNTSGRRYWNITASVLHNVRGAAQGLALMLDDLTEQKERESQLAEIGRYLPTALVKNIRSIDDVNIGTQEREITVIFADVRGFTSFSERLEPETLMQVINKYLSVASDAINLYEGIVDKYMGDAVTGLFNTQLNPQHDHAVRAVQAALSVLVDLFALHEVLPEEQCLFYGIGIHTGSAVLGNVGSRDRKEFAALGDAPEISKILQENARGDVIISEATYEQVRDLFECEQIELTKTKGRTDLKIGYRVLRRKKGRATTNLFIDPELAELLKGLDT